MKKIVLCLFWLDFRSSDFECLDKDLVERKIMLCDWLDGINSAFTVGALGCIAKIIIIN